ICCALSVWSILCKAARIWAFCTSWRGSRAGWGPVTSAVVTLPVGAEGVGFTGTPFGGSAASAFAIWVYSAGKRSRNELAGDVGRVIGLSTGTAVRLRLGHKARTPANVTAPRTL